LRQLDRLLVRLAVPTSAVEDSSLNRIALALTEAHGERTRLAPDGRRFVEDLYGGAVRLEVRTDKASVGATFVPNVYVQVYRRTNVGLVEVARRSSGWGLLERGDLRPELAEQVLHAVAGRRLR
jgi:hypothetical protein